MAPHRWSRRTWAVLYVLSLLPAETLAITAFIGAYPFERPVSYDPLVLALAVIAFGVCDVLAAFMAFYVKVTPS